MPLYTCLFPCLQSFSLLYLHSKLSSVVQTNILCKERPAHQHKSIPFVQNLYPLQDASTVADSAMNVQGGQKARYMIKHSRKTPQLLLLLLLRCCHKKSLFQRRRLNAGATKKTMSLWRTQLLRQLRSRTKSPPNSATRP
ncbi:hypothetical protein CMV_004778 [Castanea mollissima]|uniref:Uncharacterized protein n=1 Tax=Castanea mollissima TaxID=60419 RepID=A0A8J4RQZ7_9ROSI|nr:hypothetical protein CMV_004778 [Castanea mollissima]